MERVTGALYRPLRKLTKTISYHSAFSGGNYSDRGYICGRWFSTAIESIGQRTCRSSPCLEQHHPSVGAFQGRLHGRMVPAASSPSELHPVEYLQRQSSPGDFCSGVGDRRHRGGHHHRDLTGFEQCRTGVASFICGGNFDRSINVDCSMEGDVCGE